MTYFVVFLALAEYLAMLLSLNYLGVRVLSQVVFVVLHSPHTHTMLARTTLTMPSTSK